MTLPNFTLFRRRPRALGPVEVEVLPPGASSVSGVVPAGCVALQFSDATGTFAYTASRGTVGRLLAYAQRELEAS